MEYVTLNNGVKMPIEGFGVFQVPDPAQCEQAVVDAVASGYRLIDTAAQVALRWNVQRGVTVIPKSVHKERMEQNLDIWDFTLSDEDMTEIAKLDLGHSEIVNHDDPAFVKMLHSRKLHEIGRASCRERV